MKAKKLLSLILVLIFLLGAAVSCKKDDKSKTEDSSDSETQSTSDVVEDKSDLYDEDGYLKDSLPELDYDGYTVNIFGWNGVQDDFYAEVDVGDTVLDSVYIRNEKVKKRLNIEMGAKLIAGANGEQAEFVAAATNALMNSGDESYDLIACYSMCSGTLATQGMLCDLNTLDYLDFEKPWWSKTMVDMSTINDELYFVTGDLANSYLYELFCIIYNKNLGTEYGIDDPRQMVLDGTWTFEAMQQMCLNKGADIDGVTGESEGDRYGFMMYSDVHQDVWLSASGIRMAETNSDGILQLTDDFTGNKTHTLITTVNEWFAGTDVGFSSTWGKKTIMNGDALFGSVALSTIKGIREVEWDFSILPYPKMLETQDDYCTHIGFAYTNFCIPITVSDPDRAAAVMECMGSEAHRTSAPILYENVFKHRFSQDALDKQMYDVLRRNVYSDPNRIFSSSFVWADSAVSLFRRATHDGNSNWMSAIDSKKEYINGILASISVSITG